jgi:hypothetical protein
MPDVRLRSDGRGLIQCQSVGGPKKMLGFGLN